jgi:hypothetical protein
MEAKRSHSSSDTKMIAVELWLTKFPLKKIRDQLQMSKAILKGLLVDTGSILNILLSQGTGGKWRSFQSHGLLTSGT